MEDFCSGVSGGKLENEKLFSRVTDLVGEEGQKSSESSDSSFISFKLRHFLGDETSELKDIV